MSHATIEAPAVRPVTTWTMPANLTAEESLEYRRGYSRACRKSLKVNGSPAIAHDGPAPRPGTAAHRMLSRQLAGTTAAMHENRHADAHATGMRAVRAWVRKHNPDPAARLAVIEPDKAPTTRKPGTVKPAPVAVAPDPAPVMPVHDGETAGGFTVVHVGAPTAPVETPADAIARELSPTVAHIIGQAVAANHAGDTVPAEYVAARRYRKAIRCELAAMMRAAGIEPSGDPWSEAIRAAGIWPVAGAVQ